MFTNRLFYLLIVIALFVVTACAPQVVPTATSLPETNTPQVEVTITETPSPTAVPPHQL